MLVTGLTAERMAEIEAASIVSGTIREDGTLILTTHGGTHIEAGYVLGTVPFASDTVKGLVELATNAETQTGTDSTRAVTPASLSSVVASTAVKGLVELATTAETETGTDDTRAVTPAALTAMISSLLGSLNMSPVGSVNTFAGSSAPSGWLLCDGQLVSRTTYASLFTVIGTTYGAGDGSTTFALPNLKGRVVVGYDSSETEFDTLGETGGSKTNTHNHYTLASNDGVNLYVSGSSNGPRSRVIGGVAHGMTGMSQSTGTTREDSTYDEEISIIQPYLTMNYIIRY